MKYINISEPTVEQIAQFKNYVSVVDDKAIYMLKTAMLRIQEYSNRALLICEIETSGSGSVILYPQDFEIISVTADGENVEYKISGDVVILSAPAVIRYKTVPNSDDLMIYAYQLASAMFDGNTSAQNEILNQIPICLTR